MNLIEYNNGLDIHPEALVLKPFKDIYKDDKSKSKDKAMRELAYVYFYCDYKSDFSDILDEKEKEKEIKLVLELPETWKPSNNVLAAIEFYKERQKTPSMHLLEAALQFTKKIKDYYNDIDLFETDKNGKYLHNVTNLQKGISELANQTESLRKLKETVSKEIAEASRIKGGGEKGLYEDI